MFPPAERIQYQKNSLEEVSCKFTFPINLQIETEAPANFQKLVQIEYPDYEHTIQSAIPDELAPLLPIEVMAKFIQSRHRFKAQHETLALTQSELVLTSRNYQDWETFYSHIESSLGALREVYSPPYFNVVGLRYKNVIKRSQLGLEGVEWRDLLQPHVLGEMSADCLKDDDFQMSMKRVAIKLSIENGFLRLRHGLAYSKQKEVCYLIDGGFYAESRTDIGNTRELLDYFNQEARRLFQWCIKPRLHQSMEPGSV